MRGQATLGVPAVCLGLPGAGVSVSFLCPGLGVYLGPVGIFPGPILISGLESFQASRMEEIGSAVLSGNLSHFFTIPQRPSIYLYLVVPFLSLCLFLYGVSPFSLHGPIGKGLTCSQHYQ